MKIFQNRKACSHNMKKFAAYALLIALVVALASPVFAWEAAKQKKLPLDGNKMQWYILDYGKNDAGVPFAISRKYYTNATIKNETIELLMSKFGISPEVANSLYFTEYGYEYTEDGQQYAMTYLRHYNMLGDLIHGTDYEGEAKTFASVAAAGSKHAVYQGASLALGKAPAAATKNAATTKKSSTVPSKRVVRAKKK